MDQAKTRRDAELAAEVNHFRTEAINQELESGDRMPLLRDPMTADLPAGMETSRPALPKDDMPAE